MENISFCGINCEKCPVYVATIDGSLEKKQVVSREWGELYDRTFSVDEMICYGCKSDIRFFLCSKCDIESCNRDKGIGACRSCATYPCERIKAFNDYLDKNDVNYR